MEQDRPVPIDEASAARKPRKKWLIENIVSFGLAILLVFMIRSSVIEAFKIPSGSMIPTLLIGDHIFVNKFAYGLKVPFSDLFGGNPIVLIKRDLPKRGDIVVFLYPRDPSLHYIKRVVGIPGDSIQIKNKVLYINNQPIQRDPMAMDSADQIIQKVDDPKYTSTNIEVYREHFENGNPTIFWDRNGYATESFGPYTVPEDNIFVMGDNRDYSNDSRFWGTVPLRNVKGRAMFVWLSIWISPSEGKYVFRPDRIGTTFP